MLSKGPASEPTLDLGCGTLVPVRSSELCVVYHYGHDRHAGRHGVEDKPFEANGLVITTAGRWEYRGVEGHRLVDRTVTITGTLGRHFGCRHLPTEPDANLIVALRPHAIDADEPQPFGKEAVPLSAEMPIRLALGQDTDDDFESCVFEVLDSFAVHSRGVEQRPHGYLRMQRLKRFIEHHLLEDISLATLADLVKMSPFALLRQFKAHAGMTPHEYVMSLRFADATRLLSQTMLPVREVASRVGFSDQRYFARWFLRRARMSPTSFRANASP